MNQQEPILSRLMAVIEQRRDDPPAESYTAQLLAGGVDRIEAKVREEAAEAVAAAAEPGDAGRAHLVHEAADLIYHLLVLLASRHAGLGDMEAELARRFGISGIEEQAQRDQAS